jgi:ABC-type amino acid transport substrate-binding protein
MRKLKKIILVIISFLTPVLAFGGNIRILTTEEAPTNYTYAGELTGTSVDIVKEIKRVINEDAEIEVYPWARSYRIAKNEPNIAIFTAGKTQERVDLGFKFVGPIFTRQHILYKKKGNPIAVKNIQDIKNQDLVVGCMRDDWRSSYFEGEGVEVDEVSTQVQNLRKLLVSRLDLWALSDVEAPSVVASEGYTMDVIEPVYVYRVASSYIMLSKGTSQDIVDEWQKALRRIETTGFFDKLTEKWSDILEMELDHSKEKGVFIKE